MGTSQNTSTLSKCPSQTEVGTRCRMRARRMARAPADARVTKGTKQPTSVTHRYNTHIYATVAPNNQN